MNLRGSLGDMIFARVAGDEGPARRERIHHAPGPRRFGPGSAIWRVHADASMFPGGIRALLLQSLHPLAMVAVDQHSGFRGDPWGRLNRTSAFLAETTFGRTEDADRAIAVVRAVHARIEGVAPDGRTYRASDPRLLLWVHVAEVDSFLRAHDRYGAQPLDDAGRDEYVAQTVAELDEVMASFRPELASTPDARRTARFLLVRPPDPVAPAPSVAADHRGHRGQGRR